MTMLHEDKPNLDDTLLEHHGIKGMRWGVRSSRPSTDAIKDARMTVARQNRQVHASEKKIYNAKPGSKERAAAAKTHGELKLSYLNNPDRATALRLTLGEKAGLSALGLAGKITIGRSVPVAFAGAAAGRYAYRKTIESRQARDYYTRQAQKSSQKK